MKRNEFIEKIAADNREYAQALLEENERLGRLVAELDSALSTTRAELERRNRDFAERFIEVEQQRWKPVIARAKEVLALLEGDAATMAEALGRAPSPPNGKRAPRRR